MGPGSLGSSNRLSGCGRDARSSLGSNSCSVLWYFSNWSVGSAQCLLTSKPLIAGTDPIIGRSWAGRRWFVWPTILSGLVLLLYAPVLKNLVLQWWSDPDYSHGFFVPLFSGYILWRQRERWLKAEIKPSNFGLLVMLGAVGLLLVASLGAELFTTRFSLLVLLAGMVLFLAGWKFLRAVSFPLCFLIFMIPLPQIVYNQITFPLQLIASRFAAFWLELVHVPVLRDGNILVFSNYSLEVVEACSGIRSLMTLISLALIYGYLLEPRLWVRIMLVSLMVPIAIVSNAIRIMGAGVMAHRFGPAAAEGFLHEFSGWVIFLVALVLLFASHWILRRIGKVPREAAHA
jgi:exosortase